MEAEFSRRLLQLAQAGEVHDERLMDQVVVKVSGASGNTTALVGTPERSSAGYCYVL